MKPARSPPARAGLRSAPDSGESTAAARARRRGSTRAQAARRPRRPREALTRSRARRRSREAAEDGASSTPTIRSRERQTDQLAAPLQRAAITAVPAPTCRRRRRPAWSGGVAAARCCCRDAILRLDDPAAARARAAASPDAPAPPRATVGAAAAKGAGGVGSRSAAPVFERSNSSGCSGGGGGGGGGTSCGRGRPHDEEAQARVPANAGGRARGRRLGRRRSGARQIAPMPITPRRLIDSLRIPLCPRQRRRPALRARLRLGLQRWSGSAWSEFVVNGSHHWHFGSCAQRLGAPTVLAYGRYGRAARLEGVDNATRRANHARDSDCRARRPTTRQTLPLLRMACN